MLAGLKIKFENRRSFEFSLVSQSDALCLLDQPLDQIFGIPFIL